MGKIDIKALENGPVLLPGSARVQGADGAMTPRPGTSVALCRCGHSADKPFCDGSHGKQGFRAPAMDVEIETA